jgi:hypothetical protein
LSLVRIVISLVRPAGRNVAVRRLLLLADDLAHHVHRLADAAPNVAFSLLGLALAFEVAVADDLAGLLLNRSGDLLEAVAGPSTLLRLTPLH